MTKIPPRWPCGVDERRLIYHHRKQSHLIQRAWSELPRPTAFGPPRLSLVEVGGSCFCVGVCIRRGHSVHETQRVSLAHQNAKRSGDGSRLRRRLPFTGGSECPTPTDWTLGYNRRCAFLSSFERPKYFVMTKRRSRFEPRSNTVGDVVSIVLPLSTAGVVRGRERASNSRGRCIPSLLASSTLAEEGALAPSIIAQLS